MQQNANYTSQEETVGKKETDSIKRVDIRFDS